MNHKTNSDVFLKEFCTKHKKCIIVEGSVEQIKLKNSLNSSNPLNILNEIATTCGYNIIQGQSSFGLQKNYDREHNELPAISPEEFANFIIELEKILFPLADQMKDPTIGIPNIIKEMPADVLTKLSSSPLPLNNLPDPLVNQLFNFVSYSFLGKLAIGLKQLVPAIFNFPNYEITQNTNNEKISFSIKSKNTIFGGSVENYIPSLSPFDGNTLLSVMNQVEKKIGIKIQLANYLEHRPVSIYGLDYISDERIIRDISRICGLQMIKNSSHVKISQPKSVQSSDIRKIPDQIAVIMPDPFRRYLTLSDRKYNLKPRLGGSPAETMMRKLYRMSLYQVDAQFKKNHSSVMLLAKETDVVKLSSEFILCNKIMTMLNNSFNLTDPLVRKKSEMYAGIEFKMRSGIAYIECALLTIIPSGVFDPSIKWSVPAPKELVEKFLFK